MTAEERALNRGHHEFVSCLRCWTQVLCVVVYCQFFKSFSLAAVSLPFLSSFFSRQNNNALAEVRLLKMLTLLLLIFLPFPRKMLTSTYSHDPTLYFSSCVKDVLQFLVAPMVKDMQGVVWPAALVTVGK